MLTIRLSRIGKRKQPSYRIIVLEKEKDPFGDYLELLGNFNPRTKEVNLKVEKIKHWISVGAQPSNTVHNILIKEGVIGEDKKKKSVKITKKRKAKKEKSKAEDQKTEGQKPSVEPVEETLASGKEKSEESAEKESRAPESEKASQEEVKKESFSAKTSTPATTLKDESESKEPKVELKPKDKPIEEKPQESKPD